MTKPPVPGRRLALLVTGLPAVALAAGTQSLEPVVVKADSHALVGVADSATEGTVTAEQLAQRPLLRPAEVMEAVPGLIVTQHSGDGKANQYFLRGFNLDHGSDFATSVMGMPVNMVSHAHGQGYMDLNFLIPELVGGVAYRKGVYAVEDGDFATTGAAHIDYVRGLRRPFASLEAGANGYRRALLAGSTVEGEQGRWLGALELARNDGPWDQPEGLRKHNGVLRWSQGSKQNGLALTAMGYDAQWTATEHVPERAILSGEIGRYGALLPTDGGRTQRASLSAEWARPEADGQSRADGYVMRYALHLFSNPSGFISGPQGDQHEQADQRITWGGHWQRRFDLGEAWQDSDWTWGAELRQDRINTLGLYTTEARQRTGVVRQDRVLQTHGAWFTALHTPWQPWLRTSLGLRQDRVQARVTPVDGAFNADNGGRAGRTLTSPKLGVVLGPFDAWGAAHNTEFYGNWGQGFHSNDARGATARTHPADGSPADPVPLLVAARGGELGVRTVPLPGWQTSLSLWRLQLGSELVFIGDEGVTEPKGGSQRYGFEWSNYWTPARGWIVDGDVAGSRARFNNANPDNGGRHVPNAIPLTASLGVAVDPGGAWFGGLRWRYLGSYALEETATEKSRAFWMANLKLGWRATANVELSLNVLNLFNSKANDIEYWGGACTAAEGAGCNGGAGLDGRLLHPLEPRTLRLGLRVSL